ncbi:MAG TPA: NosD domain-containing protein [Gemmataceae bacterium]|jgi:parallel beta-helix repeat protein
MSFGKGLAMLHNPLRTVLGHTPRRVRRAGPRLRLVELEARTTPSTLLVDDNFTPNPAKHKFNSIQAAVDAAHPHDTIKVFAGTYTEAVTITKNDLDLIAAGRPGTVRIQAPAGADIAVHVAGGAKDVDIVGFTIVGGNAGIQFGTHFDSPASESGSGSARGDTVFGYAQVGIEVIGTGSKATIAGDIVRGPGQAGAAAAPIGIQVSDNARANVTFNLVSNNVGNADNEGVGILVLQTSNVNVARNVVFGNDEGILLASFPGEQHVTNTTVTGNRSFNNTFNGIGVVNADNNLIDGNDVSFNGFDGINVGSDPNDPNALPGTATGNTIRNNFATLNGRAGIFLESTATGNTVTRNVLRNNNTNNLTTGADAVDLSTGTGTAGTANTWRDNRGNVSIPSGLVTPKTGGGHDHDHDDHHGHGDDDHDGDHDRGDRDD